MVAVIVGPSRVRGDGFVGGAGTGVVSDAPPAVGATIWVRERVYEYVGDRPESQGEPANVRLLGSGSSAKLLKPTSYGITTARAEKRAPIADASVGLHDLLDMLGRHPALVALPFPVQDHDLAGGKAGGQDAHPSADREKGDAVLLKQLHHA